MKVLFDHLQPFLLAHGGVQIQILQTQRALEQIGIEVEFLRWWDEKQTGSIIHYFGAPSLFYLELAHRKNIPVLLTTTFSETCNRPDWRLKLQGVATRTLLRLPGWTSVRNQLRWNSYQQADCHVVGLEAERDVLRLVYGVPDNKIRVVGLGLSDAFLNVQQSSDKDNYLITVGTINEVKRSIELGRIAKIAQVPLLFVGKPYDAGDAYWKTFRSLIDNRYVMHRDHVEDTAALVELYRKARGFVIYSSYENWCLSAHEAAACGLPLLLPRKKWALERFGNEVAYFRQGTFDAAIRTLAKFYRDCSRLAPPKTMIRSWRDVAQELAAVYKEFCPKG